MFWKSKPQFIGIHDKKDFKKLNMEINKERESEKVYKLLIVFRAYRYDLVESIPNNMILSVEKLYEEASLREIILALDKYSSKITDKELKEIKSNIKMKEKEFPCIWA